MISNPALATTTARASGPARLLRTAFWGFAVLIIPSCGFHNRLGDGAGSQASHPVIGGIQLAGTAVRSTAVATVRQPVSTARLAGSILVFRTSELVRGNIPVAVREPNRTTGVPGSQAFSDSLTRLGLPEPALGTVELLVDGKEFFPAFENEIKRASHSIDIHIYIWDNDAVGVRFADLVRERAREIPVRVLVDDLGTSAAHAISPDTPAPPGFEAPPDIVVYLRNDSPLQARRSLNPLLVLDHTKLLVFDRHTAILGGMNIGQEYLTEWHDLMVRVRGPIVDQLHLEMEKEWDICGPLGDFARLGGGTRRQPPVQPSAAPPGAYPIRMLRTEASEFRHEILDATIAAISASQKRVWLANPYVINDRVIDALIIARRRGVEVRVIIPTRSAGSPMDIANLASARQLLRVGATVYQYPRMNHMKAMICDGWATMGAANLDTHSLFISHELNISFSEPRAVDELERRVFRKDFSVSRRLVLDETISPLAPIIEPVMDQL